MNDALRYIQHDPSQPSQPSPNPSDGPHYEKHGKGEPVCIDEEIPFEVSGSWEWARLESLLSTSLRQYGISQLASIVLYLGTASRTSEAASLLLENRSKTRGY